MTPSPPSLRLTVTSLFLSHPGQRKVNEAVSLQLFFFFFYHRTKRQFSVACSRQTGVQSCDTFDTVYLWSAVLLHIVLMLLNGVKVNVTHFCTNWVWQFDSVLHISFFYFILSPLMTVNANIYFILSCLFSSLSFCLLTSSSVSKLEFSSLSGFLTGVFLIINSLSADTLEFIKSTQHWLNSIYSLDKVLIDLFPAFYWADFFFTPFSLVGLNPAWSARDFFYLI